MSKRASLPNLGCIGTPVAAIATAFIAGRIACVAVIVLAYGPSAYFYGGLRVSSWKHGMLSDGTALASGWHLFLALATFLLWSSLLLGAEYIATLYRRRR